MDGIQSLGLGFVQNGKSALYLQEAGSSDQFDNSQITESGNVYTYAVYNSDEQLIRGLKISDSDCYNRNIKYLNNVGKMLQLTYSDLDNIQSHYVIGKIKLNY